MARRGQARGHHSDQHPREVAQAEDPVRPPRLLRPGDLPGLKEASAMAKAVTVQAAMDAESAENATKHNGAGACVLP